jgi:hypothetical protein
VAATNGGARVVASTNGWTADDVWAVREDDVRGAGVSEGAVERSGVGRRVLAVWLGGVSRNLGRRRWTWLG